MNLQQCTIILIRTQYIIMQHNRLLLYTFGDGSVKEYGKFKTWHNFVFTNRTVILFNRDMNTGELKQTTMYDATVNRSSEFSLINNTIG